MTRSDRQARRAERRSKRALRNAREVLADRRTRLGALLQTYNQMIDEGTLGWRLPET